MAYHGDMLSMLVCHLGVFFGFFGLPSLRYWRTAMINSATPIRIFAAKAPSDGAVLGAGGWSPGHHQGEHNDNGQRHEPSEDEAGTLPDTALRSEHQEEGRQGDRLERDDQPDDDEFEGDRPANLTSESGSNLATHSHEGHLDPARGTAFLKDG